MRDFSKCLVFSCLVLSPIVFAQASTKPTVVNWTQPESLNPLQENIGDFLDVDLEPYAKKAYDAYQAGNYQEAARYYLVGLRYDITDANSIYNLACCYGLLGKDSLAAKYLKRAEKAGFDNIEHLKKDPDFEKVRGKPVFDAAVDSIDLRIQKKKEGLGEFIVIDAPALFKCRVHLPEDYDSTKAFPLVIGLHGLGSSADRFITLWKRFGQSEFIYAAPQAPYPFSVGKEIGYSWYTRIPGDSAKTALSKMMSENYIIDIVREMSRRYKTNGVYLLGFSQGCGFTYTTGIKHHELFKGLICFGGWLDTDWLSEEAIEAAKGLRIFIAHGKQDNVVEYDNGAKARNLLKKHGYDVTFRDFKGGHTVNEEVLKQAVKWMKR
ncbi:hypothetical protein CH330_09750 [candidate division WOR-3 bacterium JGI_Cruoil_03_51_56]|uniref:Phospholipase/carboxylesterase/thioesterase domain-containing protein n=1 Tax=candidate division WOR-3 bacterium JGI_Cruoil_03_51_56 TaxID=1973747 RepID=A0A235BP71_UNCW3|nr:MAG: hypothetical protein CH330_09750 [candidate division WOR-3 bacterium JGI_Cruoil_03_51_56]